MSKSVWRALSGLVAIAIVAIALMGMSCAQSSSSSQTASSVTALPGYHVSVFAAGGTKYSNPDSVVADGSHIFVGYQNVTAKDGSDHKYSTVVEYSQAGDVLKTFSVPGHCDGLRVDPATHLLWATANEDGNPNFFIIDPSSGAEKQYTFAPTPHGGGYDDLAFTNGMVFIAASNPNLNSAGVNVFPALDKVTFSGTHVVLTPVLMGNDTALDTTTNKKVTLNEIDPDSLSLDPQGDVVLDNQAGAELVFLHNAGTAKQTATRVPLGTQVDDSAWATAKAGKLFLVDSTANTIYTVDSDFTAGTVYTEAPSDSTVAGFVGTIDLASGTITPIIIGLKSPTGLIFVADN